MNARPMRRANRREMNRANRSCASVRQRLRSVLPSVSRTQFCRPTSVRSPAGFVMGMARHAAALSEVLRRGPELRLCTHAKRSASR